MKPRNLDCWMEVMIDMEGPSTPADKQGNKYVLSYVCCLCHGLLLEPCKALTSSEVRRAFARCVFRSGTLPTLVRSDRGQEFRSVLMQEYIALLGARHKMGTAWRPMEQGVVERAHQELQKILGMLVTDVLQSYKSEWSDLLVIVEFLVYTTPGPHGYTPRDLDRRWSLAVPLEKDFMPMEMNTFEQVSDFTRALFENYRELRAKVTGWYAATSAERARLANRWRRNKAVEEGDKVLYRDPRAKAVGGRTPWREPLSQPCVIQKVLGNKVSLKTESGATIPDVHLEDVIVIPAGARMIERNPLDIEDTEEAALEERLESRRSPGEMIDHPADQDKSDQTSPSKKITPLTGKLAKI